MKVGNVGKKVILCLVVLLVCVGIMAVLIPGKRSAAGSDGQWIEAYRNFLEDKDSYINIMSTQNSSGMQGFITGFFLNDIDQDGTPELLIDKYMTAEYIYTYTDNAVRLKSIMPYVESENSINMVNASNGRLYTYAYIGNNGEMQAAKLYQISYDKEGGADASDINIIDNGKIFLYQDNLAQEETEAAETENTISKRKFSSIFKKLVPAQFKEINQDNLDKYLVEDYEETDMYEIPDDVNQAIETYWKSLQDRKNAFDNSTVTLPRSSAEVLSDADNAGKTIYFAEDGLSCYPEERVEWSYTDDREAAIYAYMDMLSEYTDDEYDRYALIYIDEDDVPELIMDKKDNFFVICTYKDGEIYAGEDMNYNFYSRYYSYYENENIIQIYYTNGTDWGEEFYHLANGAGMECFMTVNARASKTSSGAVRVDSQASPLQNYYVDGTNVSHEEFYNKIADVSEKQPINMMNMHYNSREEMLEILTDEL